MSNGITAADYNFLDPKVRANPYPYYEALRRESPIHQQLKCMGAKVLAIFQHKHLRA